MAWTMVNQLVPPFIEEAEGSVSNRWGKWREQFDAYLAWKDVSDHEEKFKTLMMFGGPDVRRVAAKVTEVENTIDNRYRVAMELLDEYFVPRVSKTFERQKFRQMAPGPKEKLDTFVIRLKQQATNCNFGDQTEYMIVDQIVTTTKDTKLKRRCLEKDLLLKEVLDIARTHESVELQLNGWEDAKPSLNELDSKTSENDEKSVLKVSKYTGRKCTRCDGKHDVRDPSCPAKTRKCNNCGQTGHFARCCFRKHKQDVPTNSTSTSTRPKFKRFIREIKDSSAVDEEEVFDLFHLGSGKRFVNVEVGRHPVKFIIDTGADENVLAEGDWKTLKQAGFEAYAIRKGSQKMFNAYGSSQPLEVLGEVDAEILFNGRSLDATFYVIAGGKCSLLSGDAAIKLGIIQFTYSVDRSPFPSIKVSAFVNEAGPDRLRLTVSPPAHVIITANKNTPVYLPCHAEADIDSNDWADSDMDGDLDMDDAEYENNANEEVDILNPPHIERQGFYEDTLDLHHLAHDNINTNGNDNDLQEEEDEYEDELSSRYRRSPYGRDELIEYVWYRNGLEFFSTAFQNQNHKQTHKGFRLFPNGTLKIPYNRQMSNISAGVYRCRANLTRHGSGSILSTESVVTIAYLERNNLLISDNNTVIANTQRPLVLHCPFDSHPPANITWIVNKTQIVIYNYANGPHENRYYQLHNGSLLVTDIRPSDAGRYRCNASNNFASKNLRSYGYVVAVQPSNQNPPTQLLPRMQTQILNVRIGATLKLNCAGESGRPRWTFTPRQSKIPINLDNFTYQLLFTNVSVDKHEGIYNCSLGADAQLYNVTILVPPMFLNNMTSYTSSVVASMSFNCSASGNPPPKISWFKNGREIKNSYIVHYNYPILRINTIDPEDEGLYQCIAKNEAGEASVSMYLSIRDKDRYRRLSRRPESIQCFPVDTTSLYVRFERGLQHVNTDYAMYYLASGNPYSWFSSPPTQLLTNNSLKITGPMVVPFRNYTVYLRTCSVTSVPDAENTGPAGKKQVIPSKLSKGVQCTSQGVPVLSIFLSNGIFIWWPRFTGVEPTAYTIQIKHNGSSSLPFDAHHINGTVQILDDYITHEEVEPLLTSIKVSIKEIRENVLEDTAGKRRRKRRRRAFDMGRNRKQIFESLTGTQMDLETAGDSVGVTGLDKHDIKYHQVLITQIKVPGNVTGIFIPNTKNLNVRILGSVTPDGEPMLQDLHYIQWKTIDSSIRRPDAVNRFQTNHVDARSVQFTWSRFIATDLINKCLTLCYKNVNHDVFIRGGSNRINCVNIPRDATHYNLVGLLPFTLYKAFLKPCHSKEPISDVLDFQTKQDVPGPVTDHALTRKNGITLTWGPPENRNGLLQGYLIQWIDKDNVNHSANLTIDANQFLFPNVSTDDKINISIMAIGSTGIGIPIYVNLLSHVEVPFEPEPEVYIPWVEIGIGSFTVICLLMFCCLLVIHRKNCKKPPRNQTATVTTAALQMHSVNCNADTHEMQTLIGTSEQLPVLIPNGKYKQPQPQIPVNPQQSVNTFGSVRIPQANSYPSNNPETQNGKSQLLSSNKNGLLQQTTISSSTDTCLLSPQQPAVSSHVLGSNISKPFNPLLKASEVPDMEPDSIPNATSSNSIYRSTNSSYHNNDGHREPGAPTGGYNLSGRCTHMVMSTGEPNQLQPKHSYRTTTATDTTSTAPTIMAISTTIAEHVPSSAATSTSLSSASNFSTTSAGSNGSTMSSCSVQSQQQQQLPQLQQHRTAKYCTSSNGSHDPISHDTDPAAAVRIKDNPQYSKNVTTPGGYHSPAAVMNTSLFDSSQRRLLDLTIDSNSIEPYDDDVTNCDQNDDANQLNTSSNNPLSAEQHQQQQLSVRMRLAPASRNYPGEECNNNEQQRADDALSSFHSDCIRLQPHRQQLLNSTGPCNHNECDIVVQDDDDDDDDDEHHLEDLDNSSSLLNESSISTKPLHQQHTSSWNFRRPIVGPNG